MAGIKAVEIQYKTTGDALVAVISGEVDYTFTAAVGAVSNRAKARAMAVTTAARVAMLPDVPTMAEAALPGYEMPAWRSILGPAGMRREIVESLNSAITRALASPDVRDLMQKAGSEPLTGSPDEVRRRFVEWVQIFGKIAKDGGLKPM
jgi:tripartite-type tricarboxylate transporter receptor subunit TctC